MDIETKKNVRCPYKDCNAKTAIAYKLPAGCYGSWIINCPVCGRESPTLSEKEIEILAEGESPF